MVNLDAANPLSKELLAAVGAQVAEFIANRSVQLAELGGQVGDLAELAAGFTSGGKRIRPAFCAWGYVAATGGQEVPETVLRAAASLDLLHVSALVHDDVMDESRLRRGQPAAHVQLAQRHAQAGALGDPERFGRAGAILLGDLLLMWSVEMFNDSGVAPEYLAAAQPLLAAMRTEVTGGQYLDIAAQARPPEQARTQPESVLEQVARVVEYKTARYTVVRPLQIGAALGGASQSLLDALAGFGSLIGRAFQHRDDVLGVFGSSEVTGKPAGDDLREGKLTLLIANAMALATEQQAAELVGLLGRELSPAEVEEARRIIIETGSLAATESQIEGARAQALRQLQRSGIGGFARTGLAELARMATQRKS